LCLANHSQFRPLAKQLWPRYIAPFFFFAWGNTCEEFHLLGSLENLIHINILSCVIHATMTMEESVDLFPQSFRKFSLFCRLDGSLQARANSNSQIKEQSWLLIHMFSISKR